MREIHGSIPTKFTKEKKNSTEKHIKESKTQILQKKKKKKTSQETNPTTKFKFYPKNLNFLVRSSVRNFPRTSQILQNIFRDKDVGAQWKSVNLTVIPFSQAKSSKKAVNSQSLGLSVYIQPQY